MASNVNEEREIISYLLGQLSEEEQAQLEQRFLQDVEYREIIRSVEDDLIDDYVTGELPAQETRLFEEQFTLLPHRRQKLEFARGLRKSFHASQAAAAVRTEIALGKAVDHRWWSPLLNPFRGPNWAISFSLAAAILLIVVGSIWLINQSRRAEHERLLAEDQRRPQVEGQPSPGTQAQPGPGSGSSPLENRNAVAGRKDQGPAIVKPTPQPQVSIATFILPPGMARSSGGSKTFVIPQGAQTIRLQLGLERHERYQGYRAELRKASGDFVWRSGAVRAAGQTITFSISSNTLTSDKYELKLSGLKGREAEDVGYYYFTIQK